MISKFKQQKIQERQTQILQKQTEFNKYLAIATALLALAASYPIVKDIVLEKNTNVAIAYGIFIAMPIVYWGVTILRKLS